MQGTFFVVVETGLFCNYESCDVRVLVLESNFISWFPY